jgi:L-malate glycosyltransferase
MMDGVSKDQPSGIRILHITPHMGGGIGKALASLVAQAALSNPQDEHEIILLEPPEKTQFVDEAKKSGCEIGIFDNVDQLSHAIRKADIVQLEFINHPSIPCAMCGAQFGDMRLIVWCHTSGLNYPAIPPGLLSTAQKFVFTSSCSYTSEEVVNLSSVSRANLAVVSSGSVTETKRLLNRKQHHKTLRAGYVGTLNFSKLHPEFVSFIAAISDPDFAVRLIGDEVNRLVLEEQCRNIGRPDILQFCGYLNDVEAELAQLDILIYILNPYHYGTAENALLEAMAMGVVPIVLNNKAEMHIVEDGVTGLVVKSPDELAQAVDWLSNNRPEMIAMSNRAMKATKEKYTTEHMEQSLSVLWREMMNEPGKPIQFEGIFGDSPSDWFKVFDRSKSVFQDDGDVCLPEGESCHIYLERTKGSVHQFLNYYPDDPMFQNWAKHL